jgi:hypothetical protein
MLMALKTREMPKRKVQIAFFSERRLQANGKKSRKKAYPIMPQTGTGTFKNI